MDTKERLLKIVTDEFSPEIAAKAATGEPIFAPHGAGWNQAEDGLDSLDRAEFVMATEDEFDIVIPDVLTVDIRTLDQMIALVDVIVSPPAHGAL